MATGRAFFGSVDAEETHPLGVRERCRGGASDRSRKNTGDRSRVSSVSVERGNEGPITRASDPGGPRRRGASVLVFLLLLSLLAVTSPALSATRDIVLLDDGERLVGEIKGLEYGKLRIKADAYDTIQVKWDHVVALSSIGEFEINLLDGESLFGSLAEGEESGFVVVLSETGVLEVPLEEVSRIHPFEQTTWARIKGSISFGLNVASASNLFQASSHFDANYTARRYRTELTIDSLINDPASDLDRTSRHDLVLSSQRRLRGRWSSTFSAVARSNDELGLQLRTTLEGLGAYTLVSRRAARLELGGGLAFGREAPETGEPITNFEGIVALTSRVYSFGKREVSSNFVVWVYPSFTVPGRYRVELTGRVDRKLVKDFFISGNVNYSFDSDPQGVEVSPTGEDGQVKQDLALTLNIGYRF